MLITVMVAMETASAPKELAILQATENVYRRNSHTICNILYQQIQGGRIPAVCGTPEQTQSKGLH